ncbi:virulence plasmid A protein [Pseudomonas sp. SJZ085]|uniref:Tc toxin subunit A n=1 Tax=unclassified Pseudomonas TaxID=196821 RepID=UPI001199A02B|nr:MULTISPECIES: Tc toxin subunit A [unclassified Pseudomonas]TWC13328.1 virulence plasmid A protein [Pseudomonas sp. SJZ074]TWC31788.1 virulence plasmid A protein [Pseudomonas sp. SJZ085]
MDDSNDSLLHRLVDSPKADFKTAMQRMGLNSVFDITRMDKAQFALELARHCDADAGQAYDNAWNYAGQISRLYQEHQISSSDTRQRLRRSSQPDSTSARIGYQALFEEKWDQFCNEGDIAAIDSPVAYLRALYLFAGQLESLASPTERITLEQRRPDLKKLMLDQQSAFATQPMLAIVNATLQSNIEVHLAKTKGNRTVQQALASEHYPFSLPYDLHHHQCLLGLGAGKPALGELNYRISLKLPFSQDGATYGGVSQSRLEAQRLLSGLSPEQQTLLIAPIASTSSLEALHKSYGTQDITRLAEIDFFKERTGLTSKQIEQLLAAGEYAPRSSVNSPAPTREYYGASYINMRETNHALSKNGSFDQPEHLDRFDHLSPGRLDRMQRMIRLHRWTDIPFAELDTLIVNALRSEGNYTLNAKTMRALGIYRYLNRRHGITPEEFASFLHDMPIAACGNRVPLFDQVFNRTRLLENPVWQNPKKQLLATDQQTLSYLSAGLGLPITQDSLLLLIHQAEKYLPALQHNLPTASSLYRQARIARMLGLSPLECTELARLLGGDDFCKALVTGKLSTSGASQPDILDVLMAMDWAVDWLRQNDRDVLQWCRLFDETTNDLPLNENLEQQLAKLQADASLSHDPQRLVETLLHDLMDLAAEYVPSLLHMAGSDAAAVVAAINASPGVMPPLLATLLRIAEACRHLHLSSSTLATLMENPAWLASYTSKSLQPQTLYLLERFSHCVRHQAQSEENLLHYLQVANQDGPHLEKEANRLLANLLNWSPEEVSSLTALLAPKRATTMEAVDWVMRCQACCVSTGLSADLLLKATALKTQSPAADWKIVGEALIAACH